MSSKNILIIDDENDIREVAAMSLEAVCGWTVRQAGSGAEGIRMAEENRPDVILLDVMMPDMDGPSTLRSLRAKEQTADIPVIFLTAKVQAADRKRFSDMGVAAVLSKPFDPMVLGDQVAEVLGWSL
jgi:CheY-like chemotaxis protein